MAFENYASLVEEVAETLSRQGLHPKVPGWIELCESELVHALRDLDDNPLEQTGVFTPGEKDFVLPAGATRLRHLVIELSTPRRLDLVSLDKLIDVRANASDAGVSRPIAMAMTGPGQYELAPAPGEADSYRIYFYGALEKVDAEKTTSRVLREAPGLLLYGALLHSAPFIQDDERLPVWDSLFEKAKRQYAQFLSRTKFSGGTLRVRPDTMPSDAHTQGNILS